jgi:hypothetical protein
LEKIQWLRNSTTSTFHLAELWRLAFGTSAAKIFGSNEAADKVTHSRWRYRLRSTGHSTVVMTLFQVFTGKADSYSYCESECLH